MQALFEQLFFVLASSAPAESFLSKSTYDITVSNAVLEPLIFLKCNSNV